MIRHIMHGADQVIPERRPANSRSNLRAREGIHLQRQLDRKTRIVAARFVDFGDVFRPSRQQHSPVIEVDPAAWAVFGKSNLRQIRPYGPEGIFRRLAHRVVTEGSVHVIIGRHDIHNE